MKSISYHTFLTAQFSGKMLLSCYCVICTLWHMYPAFIILKSLTSEFVSKNILSEILPSENLGS